MLIIRLGFFAYFIVFSLYSSSLSAYSYTPRFVFSERHHNIFDASFIFPSPFLLHFLLSLCYCFPLLNSSVIIACAGICTFPCRCLCTSLHSTFIAQVFRLLRIYKVFSVRWVLVSFYIMSHVIVPFVSLVIPGSGHTWFLVRFSGSISTFSTT